MLLGSGLEIKMLGKTNFLTQHMDSVKQLNNEN